jgi:GT2 family glycosyltransferase
MSGAATAAASQSVTAVVPVFNGRSQLAVSLPALLRAGEKQGLELIVVDDGSDDGSAEYARSLGATVLASGGRRLGPAAARNVGAAAARSDIVLFVDADVAVEPDILDHLCPAFRDAGVVAVFGAYDDEPPHRGFASQYMNLRHHHVHQAASDEAQTFWTGLGAVRRDALLAAGGFDAQRYPQPSIEDIDLGRRLRAAGGRILRVPAMQGAHLKVWSLWGVVQTDVFQRALPWARLMREHPGAFTDLNVGPAERVKAMIAFVFFATIGLALVGLAPAWLPISTLALAGWLDRGLLGVFWQRNGAWFAVRAFLYHQIYFVYSAAAFVLATIEHRLIGRSGRSTRPSA